MSKPAEYAAKFNTVFDYIDKRQDEEFTLARSSQVACFSKYHFPTLQKGGEGGLADGDV